MANRTKEYSRIYREKNRERINRVAREYWRRNKERLNTLRKYRSGWTNTPEYYRDYYQKNRERILARRRAIRATAAGRAKHNASTLLSKYRHLTAPTERQAARMFELTSILRGLR